MASEVDVSIIVTAHHEGALAHQTMRSVAAAIDDAREHGITCEILAVLDRPDEATSRYFETDCPGDVQVLRTDCGDVGLARNFGVERAAGRYVALIDADDLWCRDWITRAVDAARNTNDTPSVFHPEMGVIFEGRCGLTQYIASNDPRFDWSRMVEINRWSSCVLLPRRIIGEIPFQAARAEDGWGYEDWHWYCELLDRGATVRTVAGTCVFIRQKAAGSRRLTHQAAQSLIRPTGLLSPSRIQSAARETGAKLAAPAKPAALRRLAKSFLSKAPPVYKFAQRLYDRVERLRQSRANRVRELPDWLRNAWRAIHDIEPQLFPDASSLRDYAWNRPADSPLGHVYRELCAPITRPASHVFVVPWLKRGGSDLETLNYIQALTKQNWADGIICILTQATDSPWAARLAPGVDVVDFGAMTSRLSDDQRDHLLATLLVQLQPEVIHLLNSPVGYRVFRKFGRTLTQHSRLFASVFCEDVTESGQVAGYAFTELPHCFQFLSGVFCDNRRFLDRLSDSHGYDAAKLFTHYHPVEADPGTGSVRASRPADGRLKILWASRFDRQKRPELLADIAACARDKPFDFHVYGYPLSKADDRILRRLRRLPNVMFHGRYDGFASLGPENFDIFLYTSQWDGMPNVVLEALAAELALVSSDVGGVGELVEHGRQGLVLPIDAPAHQYVAALDSLRQDRQRLRELAVCGRQAVAERHNWENFIGAVGSVPGYL